MVIMQQLNVTNFVAYLGRSYAGKPVAVCNYFSSFVKYMDSV